MDRVFRALADPTRRRLLDRLNDRNGRTLGALTEGLGMSRQAASRHLGVLEGAGLIVTRWRGREKLHYLNAAPIEEVADRWIGRYNRSRAAALGDLRRSLEEAAMKPNEFVYVTYIRAAPGRVWAALTDPELTRHYWGVGLHSDWKVGSPILWEFEPGGERKDIGEVILESEPGRRLVFTWHNYQPEHADHFGWSEAYLAELQKEPISRVTFEIEPHGDGAKLTVIHDGFEDDTEMLRAVSGRNPKSGGWPELLSELKSVIEVGPADRGG